MHPGKQLYENSNKDHNLCRHLVALEMIVKSRREEKGRSAGSWDYVTTWAQAWEQMCMQSSSRDPQRAWMSRCGQHVKHRLARTPGPLLTKPRSALFEFDFPRDDSIGRLNCNTLRKIKHQSLECRVISTSSRPHSKCLPID